MKWKNEVMMSFISSVWVLKINLQKLIVALATISFSLLVFIQVIFRYFLDIPLFGLEEIAVYSAVWMYFIGASLAASSKFNMSASLVETFTSPGRFRDSFEAIVMMITVLIAGIITYWGIEYLLWSFKVNPKSVELNMPMAFVYAAIPVGMGLSTIYYFIELIERLVSIFCKLDVRILNEEHP